MRNKRPESGSTGDSRSPAVDGVTDLLSSAADGSGGSVSRDKLYEVVYAELRSIAARKMASERPGHTLQATALVSEAFLRLSGSANREWENRSHFFAAASEAMRRILVDSARRHQQQKRGGLGQERVELAESRIAAPDPEEKLLQVHEVIDLLAREDAVKAEIVKLRYFVGLKHTEIADVLGINEKTVRRHWELAKIRLFEMISEHPSSA